MFKNFSLRKGVVAACVILIALGAVLGTVTRRSYIGTALDDNAYKNADLGISAEYAAEYDDDISRYYSDIGKVIDCLDKNCEYAFEIDCLAVEHCYNATKYKVKVENTVKGDIDETGKEITVYQSCMFQASSDGRLLFNNVDISAPLKVGDSYLIFVNKKEYMEEYQRTLGCNEYCLDIFTDAPTAYVLNKKQTEFIDVSKDKTFSALDGKYYFCFSSQALDKINFIAENIKKHYIKNTAR